MPRKKRPAKGPKNVHKTIPKCINFTEVSVQVLAGLSDRLRKGAPPYIRLSDRDILEALIHYADREELSFEVLFGVTAESGKYAKRRQELDRG